MSSISEINMMWNIIVILSFGWRKIKYILYFKDLYIPR